ncbi:hypothetical protein BKA62DRAFT_723558 [Auriculariales sp. MPI-PUGE-AT-0066]|nr:hypothetical protein BKA62DRAFT_723558 [Auriculariales sp. MPI-PUGE-AT-0066]
MLALNLALVTLPLSFQTLFLQRRTRLPCSTGSASRSTTSSRKNGIPVPQVCKDFAKGSSCDVKKMTARRVKYSDCEDPWVLCRCEDANMSMDTLERRWAQVPAGIRSYTGAVLATKQNGCSAVNYNRRFIRFHGDCGTTVFLHEAGHSLDAGFSGEKRWSDAVDKSSCVPDSYANASPAENWTQNNVIVTWAKHYGGWPKLKKKNSKAGCLQHKRITAAIKAKKCIRDKRPFHVKRDLEETADAALLMPETFEFDERQAITCNFTARGYDEELGEHSELFYDNEPFSEDA